MADDPGRAPGGSRAALLAAARELFAARGFDHTTVRAIAERAGINQSLLFRHFGSKEGLFAAALSQDSAELVEVTPPEDLLATTVRRMLSDVADTDPLLALLRSPEATPATVALRDRLAEPFRAAFTAQAGAAKDTADAADPDAVLRADLLLSWLLGIAFARSVLEVPSLVAADPEAAVAHVERAARSLLRPSDP